MLKFYLIFLIIIFNFQIFKLVIGATNLIDAISNKGGPYSICVSDDACLPPLVCSNMFCNCPYGQFVNRDGKCSPRFENGPSSSSSAITYGVDEPCADRKSCYGELLCILWKCQCPETRPHYHANGSCLNEPMEINSILYGQACYHDIQCVGQLSCIGNQCICPSGQTFVPPRSCKVFPSTTESGQRWTFYVSSGNNNFEQQNSTWFFLLLFCLLPSSLTFANLA